MGEAVVLKAGLLPGLLNFNSSIIYIHHIYGLNLTPPTCPRPRPGNSQLVGSGADVAGVLIFPGC